MSKFCLYNYRFVEEHQAPEKPAIQDAHKSLNWIDLQKQCQAAEDRLLSFGANPKAPIVIASNGQVESIVYMIAALSLGICFVPIDSNLPTNRVKIILAELSGGLFIDIPNRSITPFGTPADYIEKLPEPPAYIIFTSGSTGTPKGAVISYTALSTFIRWYEANHDNNAHRVYSNHSKLSFDLAYLSIFPALHSGATVVQIDSQSVDSQANLLPQLIAANCTHWVSTPSLAQICCFDKSFNEDNLPAIQEFNFCGEKLDAQLVLKLRKAFPSAKIVNSYGPTEATIAVCSIEITGDILKSHPSCLPVGKMNDTLKLSGGIASQSELIICGNSLMMGYLHDIRESGFEERTTYESGDLASIEAGLILIHDRLDSTIKLNGFRIDLGEIDYHLSLHPMIDHSRSVILERQGKAVRIITFAKSSLEKTGSIDELKDHLGKHIPGYMIPSEIKVVDALPVNHRHKIDIQALLAMS